MAAKKTVRKKRLKECDCINRASAALKEMGFFVTSAFSLVGGCTRAVVDITRHADTPKRVRAPIMAASFCPFCGIKYPE